MIYFRSKSDGMKYLVLVYFSFLTFLSLAQGDSVRKIEPEQKSSFDNYSLLIMAIVGLVLLVVLRFWFKRTRERKRQ